MNIKDVTAIFIQIDIVINLMYQRKVSYKIGLFKFSSMQFKLLNERQKIFYNEKEEKQKEIE